MCLKCIFLIIGLILIALCGGFFLWLWWLFRYVRSSKYIQCLSAEEFDRKIAEVGNEQLIDVCYPREFEKAHIRGARNINFRSSDFRKQIEKLDRNKPILLYCHSGVRSKMTAIMCKRMGFKTIYDLDRGLASWLKAGKSV